uniref:Transposase n=1 Tax=Mycobacterium sp. (strain MCS) TaxID=164756 RepID=A0A5Q5BFT3_MYCSS
MIAPGGCAAPRNFDNSDAGSQYTSLAFTEALRDSGIAGSIGSVGDALHNALMKSAIGLYKTELIDARNPGPDEARLSAKPPPGEELSIPVDRRVSGDLRSGLLIAV